MAVPAVRHRRRSDVDTALLFGALAVGVVEGALASALEIVPPAALTFVVTGLIMAVPYLLLRLADDFTGVRPIVVRGGLAGFLLALLVIAAAGTPLPGWATLYLVAYFGGCGIYAAVRFVGEARRAHGIARQRMRAAAAASFTLGAAILVAGALQLVAPAAAGAITLVLALGAALAYAAAFAPPALLRRAWREPELRQFLARAAQASATIDPAARLRAIEEDAAAAMGASRAVIALWDGTAGLLRPTLGEPRRPGDAASGEAFAQDRAVLSTEPAPGGTPGARSMAILSAPMHVRGDRIGTLSIAIDREPAFVDEELDLLQRIADDAAVVIENARMFAELAATNEQLVEATRVKTEFLANMSHELRTPLNAILGFSDLLVEQLDPALDGKQRRYFANVRDAGRHLLELLNEVLDLAKVEAGRIELRPEVVGLAALAESVVASTRAAAEQRGIAFEAALPATIVVRLDPGRARQILYNLLSNAVKFTPRGGQVSLTATARGADLELAVADTGIGIPDEQRHRVFGTFERIHEGVVDAPGTGLGLALTKRLVELHGGSIEFQSGTGGTTFTVRLADVCVERVDGDRLLIVDDVHADADLIVALAAAAGLRSEVVGSAAGALAAVRRDRPRAVVLDLRLPDDRGERVLEALKRDPATAGIPVLVVTVEDDLGRTRPLGADDHLTKPIDRRRLAAWLGAVAASEEVPPAAAAR
ncbi:MAG TPA: ATP-binding protein [Candidatus Limnocylindria bacterium]|nr:ATP-binding protein [Candidatus Limnocylindria bacterium]